MTFKTPPDDNKLKRMPRVIREAAGKAGTPAPGARVPIGHGAKFERMKEEVITVLAGHPNVEEAARLLKISTATLYRWKKIPEIAAGVDEARQIQYEQALGRVQRGAGTAVTILLKLMHDSEVPAGVRLQAADCLARHRKATGRLARLEQRLQAVQRFREDSLAEQAGGECSGEGAEEAATTEAQAGGSSRRAGHGAKYGHKKEESIIALLTQRNVEEAARVAGIGTTTLYQWLKEPEYKIFYRAARLAAFGQAAARLHQGIGSAITTMLKIMVHEGTPPAAMMRAADLVLAYATEASEADLEACLAALKGTEKPVPVVLAGGRRSAEEIAQERPRAA